MKTPRLVHELEQIQAARVYSLRLLDDLHEGEWFAMPGGVTHAAWQAGHLAMAEYRMCLVRIRGDHPDDPRILPPEYLTLFGQNSKPEPDAAKYPSTDALMATL